MNRLVSAFVLIGLLSGGAYAATPTYNYRNIYGYGTYPGASPVVYGNTTPQKVRKPHTHDGMYVVARAELSLLNWKNKYSMDADANTAAAESDSDSYSFKPVFGGSVAAGWHFSDDLRADIEAGYIGYFKDNDFAAEFSLSVPYLMAAAYHDFDNGVYLGAGLGAGFVTAKISGTDFDNTSSKTNVSPMVGLMLGFTHRMDDKLVLDLRYRLAGMTGVKQKATIRGGNHWLENKIDYILDNSISLGLRYEF